jgi:hypothetical protein
VLSHYWSLGAEEQFYLLFPVAVSFACRFGRGALPALAAGLFLASLILSEYQVRFAPEAAFYLLPSRAWELMTGTLVFFAVRHPAAHRLSSFAAFGGAALIVGSVALLAPSSRFPGLHALPACLGTAVVIYLGTINPTRLHAILGSALPRGLGKISFSLYLVHWPVLLFSARLWPYADPSLRGSIAILVSIAVAALLFIAVEIPFRRGRPRIRHAFVCRFAAVTIAGFAAAGGIVYVADGFPQRLNELATRYSGYAKYINLAQFRSFECFMNEGQTFDELKASCIPPEVPDTRKVAIIWGDSGIAQYAQALDDRFRQENYAMGQLTLSACPPLVGYDMPLPPQCRDFNDRSLAAIMRRRPALVVLGWAYWDDFAASSYLAETLDRLNAAELNVVVLGSGPRFNETVPNILARRAMQNEHDILAHSKELDLAMIRRIDQHLLSITSQHPPARFLPIFDTICPNEQCKLVSDGLPAHFDSFHTTAEGAKFHVDRFFGRLAVPTTDAPLATSLPLTFDLTHSLTRGRAPFLLSLSQHPVDQADASGACLRAADTGGAAARPMAGASRPVGGRGWTAAPMPHATPGRQGQTNPQRWQRLYRSHPEWRCRRCRPWPSRSPAPRSCCRRRCHHCHRRMCRPFRPCQS